LITLAEKLHLVVSMVGTAYSKLTGREIKPCAVRQHLKKMQSPENEDMHPCGLCQATHIFPCCLDLFWDGISKWKRPSNSARRSLHVLFI